MVVYETYDHHAGLDQQAPYQASYNITDPWYNFFTCNLGYHTAHHLQCGRHWSQLPQLHQEIKHKIPVHLYREAGFPFRLTALRARQKASLQEAGGKIFS